MTSERPFPQIALDGVVFQYMKNTGIPRVWRSLLQVWSEQGFTQHLLIIDRNNTAPRLPGVRYCAMPLYDYGSTGADAEQLQSICDAEGIDLFISTYYTTPISTASVFMAYDMIPEVMATNLNENIWREKHHAILHACQYICISQSTAHDLVQFFPHIVEADVAIAYCGINSVFAPAIAADVQAFRAAYNLEQPYFLVVGERLGVDGYKNVPLLFRALAAGGDCQGVAVVCVGGQPELEPELLELAGDLPVRCLMLTDEELRVAYSGAIALVYPSRYEGFGLPVAEAMACGCPVITAAVSSIPEVGGDAVLYVDPDSVADLANALVAVQQPDTRQMLIATGLARAQAFTWERAAERVAHVLEQTAAALRVSPQAGHFASRDAAFWSYFRRLQQDYQPLEVALAQSQRQLAQTERRLKRSQNQVQQLQQQLQVAKDRIQGMESTKAWRIRSALIALRQKLRPNSTS